MLWAATSEDFFNEGPIEEKITLSRAQELFRLGKLQKVEILENKIYAILPNGEKKFAFKSPGESLSELGFLSGEHSTEVEILDTSTADFLMNLLSSILPFVIIFMIIAFMMRQFSKGAGAGPFGFGKSRAKQFDQSKKKTTFAEVAGCLEAKNELEEIVEFLKNPQKFISIGAKIPRGIIMVGAPGTGKTLLSRAVAGEAEVPFFSISGSEFIEMFVGVGASRVRDLFENAKKNSPAIIFIDEIDAVGRSRGGPGFGGGHDEREQTLNQILSEMDGFDNETNVIVMAATNRPEVLDRALLRPGRFDRRVVIDRPDLRDRLAILQVHRKGKKFARVIDLEKIAKITAGFVGADLANVLNEAAILAAKDGKKSVGQKDLEQAVEKVMMGPERRSRVMTLEQKKITAFHEAGHAIVSHVLPQCDGVHKITIISRGMSLGSTWSLPKGESFTTSKSKFEEEMCALLGGFVAEEMIFQEPTTGASNDLERATRIAQNMVMRFGMSKLGPVVFGENSENDFLGIPSTQRNFSENVAAQIDGEVAKLIQAALRRTKKILQKHKGVLQKLAERLLKKETLDAKEFEKIFPLKKGKK